MGRIISLSAEQLADPLRQAALNPLGHEFIEEAKYPRKFNPEHFYPFWKTLMSVDAGVFFVAEQDETPVGIMGCLFVPDTFSGALTGMEHFWFVSKSARRGGRIGLELLQAFEVECDRRKCEIRAMIHLDGLRGDALARVYERRGYKPAEQCFRKVI